MQETKKTAARLYIDQCSKQNLDAVLGGIEYTNTRWGIACAAVDKNLTEADILQGTRLIAENAFKGCKRLSSVTIPNTVERIYAHAFDGCKALRVCVIPNSVTKLFRFAFYNSGIQLIDLPDSLEGIGDYCFSRTPLENAVIHGKPKLGNSLFLGCEQLERVRLPKGLLRLPDCTFRGCISLLSVDYPVGMEVIGHFAFTNCTKLVDKQLPASVTTIGDYAFRGCASLESVKLSRRIKTVGVGAFNNCPGLKELKYPKALKAKFEQFSDNPSLNLV